MRRVGRGRRKPASSKLQGRQAEQRQNHRTGRLYSPEALRLQLMGVRAGYPDLLLDVWTPGEPSVARSEGWLE